MAQPRLNDAAIALYCSFAEANVRFGIFGGYAITALGGPRESKDVDCLASLTKAQAISILDGKNGFTVIPQTRQDYVAFLWTPPGDKNRAVLVEIFCESFPGARFSMASAQTREHTVVGQRLGQGTSSYFEPFFIFKGKVRAAATREKFHDSADLRWLVGHFGNVIKPRVAELSMQYVGLAMKRYPVLERLFAEIGVDVARAKDAAKELDPDKLPAPAPGDVQKGLLG